MAESAHKIEEAPEKRKFSFWDGLWFPSIYVVISMLLRDFIPVPVAFMAASVVVGCISYKVNKPKVGFLNHFLKFQAVMLLTILVVWYVPPQLQKIMPKFWAYLLVTFVLFTAIYFVLPLDGSRRTTVWWQWVIGSLIFAMTFTLVITYL